MKQLGILPGGFFSESNTPAARIKKLFHVLQPFQLLCADHRNIDRLAEDLQGVKRKFMSLVVISLNICDEQRSTPMTVLLAVSAALQLLLEVLLIANMWEKRD